MASMISVVTKIMTKVSPTENTEEENQEKFSHEELQGESSKPRAKKKPILIAIGCFIAGACIALVIGED